MSDLPPLNWLRVRSATDLERIAKFVRGQRVNTFTGPRLDKNGDLIILLGWDDRPDSDWGRFKGNRAAIWFASEELAEKGEPLVRKGMGWPVAAGEVA